jgi:hypothetical protein
LIFFARLSLFYQLDNDAYRIMKNSKLLMTMSALFLGAIGVVLQFFPREVLTLIETSANGEMVLFVQITGALYLGFALMNWMAKAVLIGGIYARPLAIGNFLHFVVGAMALTKFSLNLQTFNVILLLTIIYALFAVFFGFVFFTNPTKSKPSDDN